MCQREKVILVPEPLHHEVQGLFVLYGAFTDDEKAMKESLLSFSNSQIHCRVIAEAGFTDERNKLFGITFILALFMACELILLLLC